MLLTLHSDLQKDLKASITHLQEGLEAIEECTESLENQMSVVAKAHNAVVDKQDDHANIIRQLQLKKANLADHSRRNNRKIRGILESVKSNGQVY